MASAAYLDALSDGLLAASLASGGPGGLPHGVGQRLEIVGAGLGVALVGGQPDQFPAHGGGEPVGVLGAKVVTVRLYVRCERPQNRGGVAVDVREREDCWLLARGAGADADGAHDGRPYPPPAAAATISRSVSPLPYFFSASHYIQHRYRTGAWP